MKCKVITFISLSLMLFGVSACTNKTSDSGHHYTENFLYDNNKHWRECTDEGCVQQVDVAIHEYLDWTVTEEATCSKPGKEVSKCSTCDYVLEREIPIKDHDVNAGWSNNEEYHWHTCKNDVNEKVDYNAHSFEWIYTETPTCVLAGKGYQKCSVCGYQLSEQDVPALGHKWELDEAQTTFATCTEDGDVTHVCSVCGEVETKHVSAGHGWKQPTYEWSKDLSKVTAKRVCEVNPEHVETETVSTSSSHLSPTCEAVGSDTYTTNPFKNSAFKQQTKVVELARCSETLEHHCEAVKYTAGEIYDECTLCHKKYNVRECAQPWADYYFPTEMTQIEETDNGAGLFASFDPDTKVATLPKHAGRSANLTYKNTESVAESVGKTYFVMTYTLIKDSGEWWDTYLTLSGIGTASRIRFGNINAVAVANFDMTKATFIKDGNVVGWNAVGVGETGTIILDISGLLNGVSSITLDSDGGVELRIDYAGFRSSQCEHDISCYKECVGYSCAGLIETSYFECEECHNKINVISSGLPTGFSAIDLGNPLAVRWSSSCYDYSNHVVTIPNTYTPGPHFANPVGSKMYAEMTLDWDNEVTNINDANFQFYFINNELTTQSETDNMYTHYYDIICAAGGITASNNGISSPTPVSQIARYLDDVNGQEISSFEKGQKIVLEIDIGNSSISQFAKFILSGTNGTVVTIHNIIYK